jgi:hypothetical protein
MKMIDQRKHFSFDQLVGRIDEIAGKVAEDYPDIYDKSAWEQLWAIQQSCLGLKAACDGWYRLSRRMVTVLQALMDAHENQDDPAVLEARHLIETTFPGYDLQHDG